MDTPIALVNLGFWGFMQTFTSSFGNSRLEMRYRLRKKEKTIVKLKYFYPMLDIKP